MANSGMTKERAALEATRSRLETALSEDENWQALTQSRAQGAADQGAPHLHDARLELLLLSNPLYRAWKHVDDAIEDLRKNESRSESPGGPGRPTPISALIGGSPPKEVTSLANLSRGIAKLIQRSLPDRRSEPDTDRVETADGTSPAAQQASEARAVAREASPKAVVDRRPLTIPSVEPAKPTEAKTTTAAPPSAPSASAPKEVAAVARPAADRPRTQPRSEEPKSDEPRFGPAADAQEVTVTFVTREAPLSRRSTAPPAHVGSDGEWSPRGRSEPAGAEGTAETPYPPGGEVEEAEVTIFTAENIQDRRATAQRDGNLRRFRKALLGD